MTPMGRGTPEEVAASTAAWTGPEFDDLLERVRRQHDAARGVGVRGRRGGRRRRRPARLELVRVDVLVPLELGAVAARLGARPRAGRVEEPEPAELLRELVDGLRRKPVLVVGRRPGDDLVVVLLAVQLVREVVLELVEREARPRLAVGHLHAWRAVHLRRRRGQFLPEARGQLRHWIASLQATIGHRQHIVGVTNVAPSGKREPRAFIYRAGVRVAGTILACDATAGSDLIFLSHAWALDARAARALPRARHGRRQILTTETTLALLGAPGARLRAHALLAGLGRPFALGELRLELFASGHGPGAASLVCEIRRGRRRQARRLRGRARRG